MNQLDDEIWTTDAPLEMLGVEVGARMTVVRLEDGRLWLHSPIEFDADIQSEIDELGDVAYVVAPNRFHHLFAGDWADAYPDAELWGAPGLPEKRDDLDFDGVLTRDDAPWTDDIEQRRIAGTRLLREVVFFHRASRTLIAADLFFNRHEVEGLWNRFYLWVSGALNRAAVSRIVQFDFRDREAVRDSYEALLEWDFERIVVAHGRIVETDAPETLESIIADAFA